MDKQSKILLTIIIVVTVVSVALTFYKTVILHNFTIIDEELEQQTL